MAGTKRAAAKKAATNKNKKSNEGAKTVSSNPREVKVVVELRIPHLEPQTIQSPETEPLSSSRVAAAKVPTTVKITPVKGIRIVDVEVNHESILKDVEVQANQTRTGNGQVSPVKPVFLFVHFTGEANTQIGVVLEFAGKEIFNSPLHIDPHSGRLVENKVIL